VIDSKDNKLIFISSHPIQYYTPLYRELHLLLGDRFQVYYLSKHGLKGGIDKQFGREVKWDIPLLEGYNYKFLTESSSNANIYKFFGLSSKGVFKELKNQSNATIILTGWKYSAYLMIWLLAPAMGHKLFLRGETTIVNELKPKKLRFIRNLFLSKIFLPRFNKIFYIGKKSKEFFLYHKVAKQRLFESLYSVDNDFFISRTQNINQNESLRSSLGIAPEKTIFVYCGKLIDIKRPLDLIKSFSILDEKIRNKVHLLIIGDGNLKPQMEELIKDSDLDNISFTGFLNQSELHAYYSMSDCLCLSSTSETWGLVVNEAMCFSCAIIASDGVSAAYDLIEDGKNGFVYGMGNIKELADCIARFTVLSVSKKNEYKEYSMKKIKEVTNKKVANEIVKNI